MWRMAILIILAATLVGALMPAGTPPVNEERRIPIRVDSLDEAEPPTQQIELGSGAITLQRAPDGHFYTDARVNGATIHFLVDTGASGVALASGDARRAGLVLDPARTEVIGRGASGEVRGQFVRLNRVELGLKAVNDSPAVVLEGGDRSLLGQSFLSQFGSVEIHGNTMVLR